ncbi:NACHT, LRR and PYD domains-containing protein 8 [Erethizon dorsatum]
MFLKKGTTIITSTIYIINITKTTINVTIIIAIIPIIITIIFSISIIISLITVALTIIMTSIFAGGKYSEMKLLTYAHRPGLEQSPGELEDCGLTSTCCEDLAAVLTSSKTLFMLNLIQNPLGHRGLAVLCEGLRHPECTLRVLGRTVTLEEGSVPCRPIYSQRRSLRWLSRVSPTFLRLEDATHTGLLHTVAGPRILAVMRSRCYRPHSHEAPPVGFSVLFYSAEPLTQQLRSEAESGSVALLLALVTTAPPPERLLSPQGRGGRVRMRPAWRKRRALVDRKRKPREALYEDASVSVFSICIMVSADNWAMVQMCLVWETPAPRLDSCEAHPPDSILLARDLQGSAHLKTLMLRGGCLELSALAQVSIPHGAPLPPPCLVPGELQSADPPEPGGQHSGGRRGEAHLGNAGALNEPLRRLVLRQYALTSACCWDVASALRSSRALHSLDLGLNSLGNDKVALLCKALAHPGCALQILEQECCLLTSVGCQVVASMHSTNWELWYLDMSGNDMGE